MVLNRGRRGQKRGWEALIERERERERDAVVHSVSRNKARASVVDRKIKIGPVAPWQLCLAKHRVPFADYAFTRKYGPANISGVHNENSRNC